MYVCMYLLLDIIIIVMSGKRVKLISSCLKSIILPFSPRAMTCKKIIIGYLTVYFPKLAQSAICFVLQNDMDM